MQSTAAGDAISAAKRQDRISVRKAASFKHPNQGNVGSQLEVQNNSQIIEAQSLMVERPEKDALIEETHTSANNGNQVDEIVSSNLDIESQAKGDPDEDSSEDDVAENASFQPLKSKPSISRKSKGALGNQSKASLGAQSVGSSKSSLSGEGGLAQLVHRFKKWVMTWVRDTSAYKKAIEKKNHVFNRVSFWGFITLILLGV